MLYRVYRILQMLIGAHGLILAPECLLKLLSPGSHQFAVKHYQYLSAPIRQWNPKPKKTVGLEVFWRSQHDTSVLGGRDL